jgi:protein-S-isoprenylcysteine O-methyltransferase Ste14
MKPLLALMTLILWPVIPLFWIPVHFATGIFRRLGRATYFLAAVVWVPVASLVFLNRGFFLLYTVEFPVIVSGLGLVALIAGSLLHIWTGALLSPRSLIGIPEIIDANESRLIDTGPFSVVRHPTYLAHTLMFAGVYFFSGITSVGVLTLVDLIVVNAVIMPLEEKELVQRFGKPYEEYMGRVPRLFPRMFRRSSHT